MKQLTLLLLLFCHQVIAQNGISFQQGTWNQILTKARTENKIIFLDAYATWCGPCKWMSANTFTDASVGSFYNKNFINAKIDMEKGEGVELATRYKVEAYPTLLFIDGNGKLLHKIVGAQEAAAFLETGRDALNPDKQFYTLKEKFQQNSISAKQLSELVRIANILDDPEKVKFISVYMKQQKNWYTRENILLLLEATTFSYAEGFKFLTSNESAIKQYVGADTVDYYLNNLVKSYAKTVADREKSTETSKSRFEEIFRKYRPENAQVLNETLSYAVSRAEEMGENALVNKYMIEFVNLNISLMDWQQLNQFAWTFYEREASDNDMKEALKWALKSVSLESNFFNNDTVAHIYYDMGDKKNARKYAAIAIKLGKEAGEDVTETESLLKKL